MNQGKEEGVSKTRGKWEESNDQRLKSLTKNLQISLTEQVPEKVRYGLGDKQTLLSSRTIQNLKSWIQLPSPPSGNLVNLDKLFKLPSSSHLHLQNFYANQTEAGT